LPAARYSDASFAAIAEVLGKSLLTIDDVSKVAPSITAAMVKELALTH
jgi:hypothetical protein